MVPAEPVSERRRLCLCKSHDEEYTTVLDRQPHEAVHQTYRERSGHSQEHRLAHLPSFLRYTAEGKWGRCENSPGALTSRQQRLERLRDTLLVGFSPVAPHMRIVYA